MTDECNEVSCRTNMLRDVKSNSQSKHSLWPVLGWYSPSEPDMGINLGTIDWMTDECNEVSCRTDMLRDVKLTIQTITPNIYHLSA